MPDAAPVDVSTTSTQPKRSVITFLFAELRCPGVEGCERSRHVRRIHGLAADGDIAGRRDVATDVGGTAEMLADGESISSSKQRAIAPTTKSRLPHVILSRENEWFIGWVE